MAEVMKDVVIEMILPMETERLIIRRFTSEDGQDLFEYLSDSEVVLFEPYEVYDEKSSVDEAVRRSKDENFYAVCLKETGKLIGNLYFAKGDFDTWELGYVFNKKYQKHGYATEAAKKLMNTAFTTCGMRKLIAMANPLNENSWRLMERLGMRREGEVKKNIYFKKDKNGEPIWVDTYLYGLLREEYEK